MVAETLQENFDGTFSLDVLVHIEKASEDVFLNNIRLSLYEHGNIIIGIPSRESQTYTAEASKFGLVNCKSGNELRDLMKKYFQSVFMFSMNDEAVHRVFPYGSLFDCDLLK